MTTKHMQQQLLNCNRGFLCAIWSSHQCLSLTTRKEEMKEHIFCTCHALSKQLCTRCLHDWHIQLVAKIPKPISHLKMYKWNWGSQRQNKFYYLLKSPVQMCHRVEQAVFGYQPLTSSITQRKYAKRFPRQILKTSSAFQTLKRSCICLYPRAVPYHSIFATSPLISTSHTP